MQTRTQTVTLTSDELFLIYAALGARITQTRQQVQAGETLGLRLHHLAALKKRIGDLYEQGMGDGEPQAASQEAAQ